RSPASVFSGAAAAAPRWPITEGSRSRAAVAAALPMAIVVSGTVTRKQPPLRGRLRLFARLARAVAQILAGRLVDLLHAELYLAAIIEAQALDLDGIADLDDVGDLADALRRQLADMDEPVARSEEVHEGAEIDDLHDLAVVDDADLGLGDDA